jgi:hypothetical protein
MMWLMLAQVEPSQLPGGNGLWELGASLLAMALLAFFRVILKDAAQKREEVFAWAVNAAYHAVNELAAMTENQVDDKVAAALRYLDTALAAQRGSGATPAERARAQVEWKAMHGLEKKAEELALLSGPRPRS